MLVTCKLLLQPMRRAWGANALQLVQGVYAACTAPGCLTAWHTVPAALPACQNGCHTPTRVLVPVHPSRLLCGRSFGPAALSCHTVVALAGVLGFPQRSGSPLRYPTAVGCGESNALPVVKVSLSCGQGRAQTFVPPACV